MGHGLDFVGEWKLLEHPRLGTGSLQWFLEHMWTAGNHTTADFSAAVGSSYLLNDDDTSPGKNSNRVTFFWWEQLLFQKRLRLIVGKIDPAELIDQNRYTRDDQTSFVSTPLSANPVVPIFDAGGYGAFVSWTRPGWYASSLVVDGESTNDNLGANGLSEWNFHWAFELGVTPETPLGEGAYRLTFYSSEEMEETESSGWAVSLSLDQDLGERFGAFLHFSRSKRQQLELNTLLATGLVLRQPLGFDHDEAAVAFVWADPSGEEEDERDQYAVELYWRLQVTPRSTLTPGLQLIFNPSKRGSDFRMVGGLRYYHVF